MTILHIALALAYFVSGALSFIYWWSKDHDFTTSEIPFALFAAFAGPFSFLLGWTIHGKRSAQTIIKKRTN